MSLDTYNMNDPRGNVESSVKFNSLKFDRNVNTGDNNKKKFIIWSHLHKFTN